MVCDSPGMPESSSWECGKLQASSQSALHGHMSVISTALLFIATAVAEIVGCYLPYLWLKKGASVWLLMPAAASLALFAWLLTLHPTAAGRVYAAYGGVYIGVAILWLWLVDGIRPNDVGCGGRVRLPGRHGNHRRRCADLRHPYEFTDVSLSTERPLEATGAAA